VLAADRVGQGPAGRLRLRFRMFRQKLEKYLCFAAVFILSSFSAVMFQLSTIQKNVGRLSAARDLQK